MANIYLNGEDGHFVPPIRIPDIFCLFGTLVAGGSSVHILGNEDPIQRHRTFHILNYNKILILVVLLKVAMLPD